MPIFLNAAINVEVNGPDNSDGRTNARTHAHTHAHTPNWSCDNFVSLTVNELDKKYVVIPHWSRLGKTALIRGHKVCFVDN